MNKKQYLEARNALLAEIEGLIAEGKADEANAKMEEVNNLDAKWEEIKLANANLNALKDNTKVADLEEKTVDVKGAKVLENLEDIKVPDEKDVYTNAWAKYVMGQELEGEEKAVFEKVNTGFNNAYTHTTVNTPTLIPETVVAGIWARAEEMYPLLADVKKYSVTGTLTINKHTAIDAGDAAWYTEGTDTADEQNTFGQLKLTGCELAKAITVSWKLRSMAVSEFIPYIQGELGKRLGVVAGTAMYTGSGVDGTEPQGIITAINAEAATPQKITYTDDNGADPLSYDKITEANGKIHSSYLSGCAIYATNATIWGSLANLLDGVGRPLFIPDITAGGVGRMFGMPVKADAGAGEGNILIGNAEDGYVFNTNEPMSLATEDHVKARETDYAAYAIVDGKVLDTKAFALLDKI